MIEPETPGRWMMVRTRRGTELGQQRVWSRSPIGYRVLTQGRAYEEVTDTFYAEARWYTDEEVLEWEREDFADRPKITAEDAALEPFVL